MTIQPTAVYPPGRPPPGSQKYYQTYNTRTIPPPSSPPPPPSTGPAFPQAPGFNYGNSWLYNQFQRVPGGSPQVNVPNGVPKFLGSRAIIMFAWGASMAIVCADEWQQYHILPRPARLWDTTLVFFLLAAASTFEALVPICSALAIGLAIAAAYNYYQGTTTLV